jgi:hypothetical protein
MIFGTWNVRRTYGSGSLETVARELDNLKAPTETSLLLTDYSCVYRIRRALRLGISFVSRKFKIKMHEIK